MILSVLFMVKARLLEVYRLLSSTSGKFLGCNGKFKPSLWSLYCQYRWERFARYVINIFKVESKQPKNSLWIGKATIGLPKGSDSYGNRAVIVPANGGGNTLRWGRAAAKTYLNQRQYSTGSATVVEANIISKLRDLHKRSSEFPKNVIDRNLYKLLCNKDLLSLAYNRLKSKPGQMTPGVSPETLDGISSLVLEEISSLLKSESFQFSPGRRIQIPKKVGRNSSFNYRSS